MRFLADVIKGDYIRLGLSCAFSPSFLLSVFCSLFDNVRFVTCVLPYFEFSCYFLVIIIIPVQLQVTDRSDLSPKTVSTYSADEDAKLQLLTHSEN